MASNSPSSIPPSDTDDLQRRRTDRLGTESDWPNDIVKNGIENRIRVAAPGDKIHIREGTKELKVDHAQDICWEKIFKTLIEQGVLAKTDDDAVYEKTAEGLGDADGTRKTIDDIVETKALETFLEDK